MFGNNASNLEHYDFIRGLVRTAASELKCRFRQELAISAKPDQSIVTDADLASERVILKAVREFWPDDLILSEEAGTPQGRPESGKHIWVIDPLDGTTNFANGYPFYSISVARCQVLGNRRIQPIAGAVYDVMNDVLFYAERGRGSFANQVPIKIRMARPFASSFLVTGFYYMAKADLDREVNRFARVAQQCPSIRRDGSAALDLALVAAGVFDAFWENGLQPWDVAAGILLVTEAGGVVRNYEALAEYDLNEAGLIAGEGSAVANIAALL